MSLRGARAALAAIACTGVSLCPAAERHQHRARANGGIEPFGQSFFAAGVQIAHQRGQFFLKRALRHFAGRHAACRHAHVHMLLRAVGVQEFALDVADDIAVPAHDKARLRRHLGHDGGLQVFPVGCGNEFLRVLFRHHNGHALLALGDGKLGAVQPVIFFRYGVQVNGKAVGQLTDGDGNTARTEVVAALDHPRCFLCAEQALQLALHRRIALLHLCTAGLQALQLVGFGGPCRAAAAVAARAAAQQDHHVSGDGLLTAHVLPRAPRPPPRRSPYAWRCSPGGTARPPYRWQGRSGCRSWNSPPRLSSPACAAAACRAWYP